MAHCADVRPGKARVFTCLLAHIDSADYRPACKDQLSAQQERRVADGLTGLPLLALPEPLCVRWGHPSIVAESC